MTAPSPKIAALLHARRFTRFLCLTRDVPWVRGECAWCGREYHKGYKYCGFACSDDANIRATSLAVKRIVLSRDKGVCSACGVDTTASRRYPRQWHADHILPVVEGGGACGLDNYQTLCVACHKAATRALARRRACTCENV